LQILTEPNLVTSNGKEASFLEGGEFPVPILQGGANAGAVTVQFREFGIRLTFNPLITPNNTLRLYVKPEVSSLDFANAVSFNGFTIPALSTRRTETTIELGDGQSFVISGLIDNRVTETVAKIPGLSALPVLGNLFKSRDLTKNKTELIVIVTPEITMPLQPGESKPGPAMPRDFLTPITPNTTKRSK
jgi:pilus assembly protein CpaC